MLRHCTYEPVTARSMAILTPSRSAGWLPAPQIWHLSDPRGWLDIMWRAPTANLHDGDKAVMSRFG